LESVKDIADEIIIVDNTSSDNTVSIAKKYTKHVFIRPNNPMLNVNKNFGFTKATGDWILNLDSDERITSELAKEIKEKIENTDIVGYWIPRKNIIFGKWIQNSIWWPDYHMRLFRNGKGTFKEVHVHELLEVKGPKERLENPMIHENYQTISQYLYKLDKIYTTNEAENLFKTGKKIVWIDAIRFPVEDFLKTFFAQKGYRDGLHGLVLSILQAFYAEIVFAKLWEKQGFEEYNDRNFLGKVKQEFEKVGKEINYWLLTGFMNETKSPIRKVGLKIKRKLQRP